MCFKAGQIIPVSYKVTKDFGDAASLVLEGEINGGNAFVFPDKKIRHCDPNVGIWYYEKLATLFVYGVKIPLEPGYEQDRGEHLFKAQDRPFKIRVKLLKQRAEQKEQGIYPANLISMLL